MTHTREATSGTRRRLLDAAITLMRRSGLSGAGINEIVRESGAPKGSVYHFFPNGKQQIVAEALDDYTRSVVAFIDASLARKRSPGAKVRALFEAFADRVEQGEFLHSCAAGTVCLDLDVGLEDLRAPVAGALDHYVDAIARHFDCGGPRQTRSFAGLLLTAIEGAYIRSRAHRTSQPFREAGAWLAELATRQSAR
jgi:TetR/AcrR family transcriptional repressor of lmrAB and yxaGH operons